VQLPRDRARLGTLKTNRPNYWKVALRGFADNPLKGVGAHGFQQLWLQKRHISESVQDAHSLYLETAAELGVVGLLLLLGWLAAVASAFRSLLRTRGGRALAAGPAAASAAFLVHAAQDWDWEMPAVSLAFIALGAALLGAANDRELDSGGGEHDQDGFDRDPEASDAVHRHTDHRDRGPVGQQGPDGEAAPA
jgi:O-antigen ligase